MKGKQKESFTTMEIGNIVILIIKITIVTVDEGLLWISPRIINGLEKLYQTLKRSFSFQFPHLICFLLTSGFWKLDETLFLILIYFF